MVQRSCIITQTDSPPFLMEGNIINVVMAWAVSVSFCMFMFVDLFEELTESRWVEPYFLDLCSV